MKVFQTFLLSSLPAVDVAGQLKNSRVVRQGPARESEFRTGAFVIKITAIKMLGPGQVRLSVIRTQLQSALDRCLRQSQPRRRVIEAIKIDVCCTLAN